jgi:predicted Zn-dependent peptidase
MVLTMGVRNLALAISFLCLALQGAAQGVQVYQLKNGMQVAYVEDSTRRLMHLGLTLRGGAAINPTGSPGFAHYFEHHFFGGIDTAAGAPGGQLRQLGMMSTEGTYLEHQTFTISMSPARLVEGLAAIATSLRTAMDRPPHHERILADIAGELQSAESSPSWFLFEAIRSRLWGNMADAKSVAGQFAAIRNIDPTLIGNTLRPYLHPGNCLLSATGPGPAAQFFLAADSLLGDWRPNSDGAGIPKAKTPC